MIYQLNDDYIDLSKLECVSGIINNGIDEYYFRFQINTYVYNTPFLNTLKNIKLIRENLIKAWKEYKDQK